MTQKQAKAASAAWAKAWKVMRKKYGKDEDVAKELGISRQAMFKWKAVPPLQVPTVSRLSGVPQHKLRPDLPELFQPPARA